ncbi:MAG: RNA-binding protein [Bacteroidota bacterium]|nr:RNA-binding protein [Flavisolibacter sp.]MBD0297622.1 RNA-binding protein [Flavisolibacter sp.]MBD0369039.1 RNA-binding protein [Flavisolibacter sp.]MDQ3844523.1 RNA-binding protein [Bacteroidota bacterium]
MNIYISNLDTGIDNEELKHLFASYGEVKSAEVVKDVFTGTSRGFGYVEMEDEAAQNAIKELNQTVLHTLTITVEEGRVKKEQKGSYKVGNGAVNVYKFRKK